MSRFVLPLALAALMGPVLPGCEDPPPEPGKPVLQIYGTRPPSIDLSLRIRYVATTEKRQCQEYTMRTTGYVPIEPTWHVWPHEPPSRKPDRRYRVVPMDTTGALPDSLQGQDLEPFRWTVNAGWGGKPTGCDFKTTDITPVFRYDKSYNKSTFDFKKREVIGEFDIDLNEDTCPGIEDDIFKSGLDSTIHIGCKWGGFDIGIHDRDKIECRIHDRGVSGYCLETLKSDTIDTRAEIRYLNDHEVK